MHYTTNNRVTGFIAALMFLSLIRAQSLDETLQTLAQQNAAGYLAPAVSAFGTGVNSGTFRLAKPHKLLGFDLTVNVNMTRIPDQDLYYQFAIPDQVIFPVQLSELGTSYEITFNGNDLYPGDRTSATFFGPKESYSISPDVDYALSTVSDQLVNQYNVPQSVVDQATGEIVSSMTENLTLHTPEGIDFSYMPMIIPQLSVGLPLDLELTVRGGPEFELEDVGTLSFLGYGGKIGLNQFLPLENPLFPRLSVGYYETNLTLGEILDARNSIINFQLSKSIPFLTFYAGYGIESSSMDVNYEAALDPNNPQDLTTINFSLDGKNKSRYMAGLRLKMAFLSLNVDYNKGEYEAVNVGVGFTFR